MSNHPISQRRWKKTLDIVAAGLDEITAYFDMEGFPSKHDASSGKVQEQTVKGTDADQVEDDSESDYGVSHRREAFPREDIELAIDAFLSHLIQERLLPKTAPGEAPSFSEVIGELFGDAHDITKKADRFEEHIKGYFGFVDYVAMATAYDDLLDIQNMIKEATGEAAASAENK